VMSEFTSISLADGATAILPAEILASIFQLSVPNFLGNSSSPDVNSWLQYLSVFPPLKLGAVCRRWREVAWSTPFLWTIIVVFLDLSKGSTRIALIEEWISRSKDLPLQINISLAPHAEETLEGCSNMLATIAKTAHRWDFMDIHMPLEFMKEFFEMAGIIPNIQTMGLHVTDEPSHDDAEGLLLWLEDARPQPRYLFLSGLVPSTVNIVWESLTTIEVDCILTEDCFNILRCSPNLELCKFSQIPEFGVLPNMGSTFVHENLRQLIYEAGDTFDHDLDLFSLITTPKLTHLSYSAFKSSLGTSLVDFISRSSCPLAKLCILQANLHYDELDGLLRATPSLTHLRLFPEPMEQLEEGRLSFSTILLLQELAQPPHPYLLDNNTISFLPRLQSLEYHLSFAVTFPWSYVPEMFGPPAAFSSPRRRPLKTLRVVNTDGDPRRNIKFKAIPKGVLPRLLELRQAGAEIIYKDKNYRFVDLFAMSMKVHGLTS